MTRDPGHIDLRLALARGLGTLQSGRAVVGDVRRTQTDLLIAALAGLGGGAYRPPGSGDAEAAIGAVIEAALARGVSITAIVELVNDRLEAGVRPGEAQT